MESFLASLMCYTSIPITAFLMWFLLAADADITLLYYEKFGRKLSCLSGKVVWITGASSGIGEFIAYDLAKLGAKLVISGTSMKKLVDVKQNILDCSDLEETDVLILPFNIENFGVHEDCVKQVIEHFGHIDVLVNNAGVTQRANFKDIDIKVDRKLFDINVFGSVNLTRKVIPHFLDRKRGQIVCTSSTAGKLGAPFSSAYTGSKHAMNGYFESVRTEMLEHNISVTIACPGPVFSSLTSRCLTGQIEETFDEKQAPTDKKMKTERCSKLMVVAMANELDECWICNQPLLLLYYFSQYMPTIFKTVLMRYFFNSKKVQTIRSGKN